MSDTSSKRPRPIDSPESLVERAAKSTKTKMSLEEINATLTRMSSGMSTLNGNIVDISNRIGSIETKMEEMKTTFNSIVSEMDTMRKNIDQLALEINVIKQAALAGALNIFGLPPLDNPTANPFPVVKIIMQKIGIITKEEDFKKLYYIQHRSQKGSHISVTCWSERKKLEILNKFKAFLKDNGNRILVEDIMKLNEGSVFKGKQLFIRNQLTKMNSEIFSEARKYRNTLFKYVWEREGTTFVKADENSRSVKITSLLQLQRIVSNARTTT